MVGPSSSRGYGSWALLNVDVSNYTGGLHLISFKFASQGAQSLCILIRVFSGQGLTRSSGAGSYKLGSVSVSSADRTRFA